MLRQIKSRYHSVCYKSLVYWLTNVIIISHPYGSSLSFSLSPLSALEECLLVMPFSQVTCLLHLLDIWLGNGWEVELCCRCLFFLLRVHHHQLVTNSTLLPIIDSLKQHTSQQVSQIKVIKIGLFVQSHTLV